MSSEDVQIEKKQKVLFFNIELSSLPQKLRMQRQIPAWEIHWETVNNKILSLTVEVPKLQIASYPWNVLLS